MRIQASAPSDQPKRADLWLLGIELQADRLRLTLLPPDWSRAATPHQH